MNTIAIGVGEAEIGLRPFNLFDAETLRRGDYVEHDEGLRGAEGNGSVPRGDVGTPGKRRDRACGSRWSAGPPAWVSRRTGPSARRGGVRKPFVHPVRLGLKATARRRNLASEERA
jgi:hypothetical protein